MMKKVLLGLLFVLLVPMAAGAASFQDTQTYDNMFFSTTYYDSFEEVTYVEESIADNMIAPYASHGGYAVVNQWGGFFDSYMQYGIEDLDYGYLALSITATNNSGHLWSDFHFEFYEQGSSFETPQYLTIDYAENLSGDFEMTNWADNSSDLSALHFWSDGDGLASGDETTFFLVLTLPPGDYLELRQAATINPIPVPASIWLLGSGLIGLIGLARRSRG